MRGRPPAQTRSAPGRAPEGGTEPIRQSHVRPRGRSIAGDGWRRAGWQRVGASRNPMHRCRGVRMTIHQSVLELIGHTPMVKTQRLDAGVCELFLKLESANPGGSIKDRIGLSMIEGAEKRRQDQARRHAGRRHRRQHRHRPRAGRAAEGLSADPRRARQDEPREDLQPQGDGRRSRADALRRRQGPSRSTTRTWPSASRAKRPARISSTSSAIPTTRARTRKRPVRKSSSRWTASVDAIVFGCGSSGTMTGLSRYFAQRRAARRTRPRRSGRLDPRAVHQRRHAVDEIGELDGRGHRRGFPAVDLAISRA